MFGKNPTDNVVKTKSLAFSLNGTENGTVTALSNPFNYKYFLANSVKTFGNNSIGPLLTKQNTKEPIPSDTLIYVIKQTLSSFYTREPITFLERRGLNYSLQLLKLLSYWFASVARCLHKSIGYRSIRSGFHDQGTPAEPDQLKTSLFCNTLNLCIWFEWTGNVSISWSAFKSAICMLRNLTSGNNNKTLVDQKWLCIKMHSLEILQIKNLER